METHLGQSIVLECLVQQLCGLLTSQLLLRCLLGHRLHHRVLLLLDLVWSQAGDVGSHLGIQTYSHKHCEYFNVKIKGFSVQGSISMVFGILRHVL